MRWRTIALTAAIALALVASASSRALSGTTYTFTSTKQGVAHGGKWTDDKNSILQADGSGKVAFPLFVFNSLGSAEWITPASS